MNIVDGIINTICDYYGFTSFSNNNKLGNVSIIESNDKQIEYFILTHNKSNKITNKNEYISSNYASNYPTGTCIFNNNFI